jgi:hypothetical protein
LAFKVGGWSGFTIFGTFLALLYVFMALLQLRSGGTAECACKDNSRDVQLTTREEQDKPPIAWIDWAVSAAFISTELQMNMFITAVPQALLRRFGVPPTYVGMMVGAGALVTLIYILALPFLPSGFNQHRPMNLIWTYSGMLVGWILMFAAVTQPYAPPFLIAAYFYQAMVGASQMVMLECLTGICDSVNSAKILGVAEMVGCAFGMVGGYAGEALLEFGLRAPFLVGVGWSLFSVVFLVLSFILRQTQRDRFTSAPEPEKQADSQKRLMLSMISGVNRMVLVRENSFLSSEIQYRQTDTELVQEA